MKTSRVVIIGAGRVGGLAGYALASQNLVGEIVFIDYNPKMAQAQAYDVQDSIPYFQSHTRVWAGDYRDADEADIVIVTAGKLPDRSKGETRNDALRPTINVINSIVEQLEKTRFKGIIINVSNPADVSAHYIQQRMKLPRNRVLSTSTTLDSARLRRLVAGKLGVAVHSVQGYMLGEHGENQVPAWSQVTVGGKNLRDYLAERPQLAGKFDFKEMTKEIRAMAWTIIDAKAATEYGIGSAIAEVVRAIVFDERKILPVSSLMEGQYGQRDVFISVPTVVGADGAGEVLEIPLSTEEKRELDTACAVIRETYQAALKL